MGSGRQITDWNIYSDFALDSYRQFELLYEVSQIRSWSLGTTLKNMQKFIAAYPDLVKKHSSTVYDRDYQASFLVYAHVKHVVNLCQSGVDLLTAIAPYAVDEKRASLCPDALAERNREVQQEVAAIGIHAFTNWINGKEYKAENYLFKTYIPFIMKYMPSITDTIVLFRAFVSSPGYSNEIGKRVLDYLFSLDHTKLAELLLDTSITNKINHFNVVDYFCGLIKRDIQEKNKFNFLDALIINYKWESIRDKHIFILILKDLSSLIPTIGEILLSRPQSFSRIKQHLVFNMEMYLQFLYWWRVGEDKLYQDLHLERHPGSADYCRVLLLRNIEYQDLLTPVIQRFSSYREVGMLLLYEALARGSKIDAEKLLAASMDHSIVKESTTKLGNVSQNPSSMFNVQEEKSTHTVNTTFTDKLSFNLMDFIKYLKDKYTLAEDKDALYFIQFIDEFVQSLLDLKIITDGKGFKASLCKAFSIELMDIENNASEVAELKSRLDAAETTNKVLERRVDNLEKELQEMRALISSLLPSQVESSTMKRKM